MSGRRGGVTRFTWLPWRWKYRPRREADGSFLALVPPDRLLRDHTAWAQREWSAWKVGLSNYSLHYCPSCYQKHLIDSYELSGKNRTDRGARRRFAHLAELARRRHAALGPCRGRHG
jgi:hypothetical protein